MRRYFVGLLIILAMLIPACAPGTPQVIEKEVIVEKPVVQTVLVEKEVAVEKEVQVTVVVEKEGETIVVTATPVPATAVPQAPTEKQVGGTLNIWQPNGWPQTSWFHLSDWESHYAIGPMAEYLFRIGADLELVPELAESYDVSDDGLTYTLHLREDVKWHDGEPFTAEDVKWTYTTFAEKDKVPLAGIRYGKTVTDLMAYQRGEATEVTGIEIVDDYTVNFNLDSPDASLPSLLWSYFVIPMSPKHATESIEREQLLKGTADYWYTAPVGTGPYKFVAYVPAQYIEYERNEDYWRDVAGPERLFLKIADPSVATVMLETGELDFMVRLDAAEAARLSESETVDVLNTPQSGSFYGFAVNYATLDGFWQDPKARQAYMYAVDRQGYINTVLAGYGRVANSFFDGTPYACPTMVEYTYDPEKAKALFDEIGMTAEKRAETAVDFMSWLGLKARMDSLPIFQSNLRSLGFKSSVDFIDNSLVNDWLAGKAGGKGEDWDFYVLMTGPGADPAMLDPFLRKNSTSNMGLWGNPAYWASGRQHVDTAFYYDNARIQELLDMGLVETDPAERTKIYQEIDCIYNEEMPNVLTAFPDSLAAKSKRLQGVQWEAWQAVGFGLNGGMPWINDWWLWQQ